MWSSIGLLPLLSMALANAETIIRVDLDGVQPRTVSVAVGERVRWRGPEGTQVELDVEDHAGQHLVAARVGDVAVTFLDVGRHPYTVRLGGRPWLDGEVLVNPGLVPNFLECGAKSTRVLCVEP